MSGKNMNVDVSDFLPEKDESVWQGLADQLNPEALKVALAKKSATKKRHTNRIIITPTY